MSETMREEMLASLDVLLDGAERNGGEDLMCVAAGEIMALRWAIAELRRSPSEPVAWAVLRGGKPVIAYLNRPDAVDESERLAEVFPDFDPSFTVEPLCRCTPVSEDSARLDWLEEAVPSGTFREACAQFPAIWPGSVRDLIDRARSTPSPAEPKP